MEDKGSLLPQAHPVPLVTADTEPASPSTRTLATRDRRVIQRWAQRREAQPSTGEDTPSGRGTVHVADGGAGIRFNFPGTARFRPISWDEWFQNFERHGLTFVYEEQGPLGTLSYRYRLVHADDWQGGIEGLPGSGER